jgi:hypothetical protein
MDDAGFDLDLIEEVTHRCFRAALFVVSRRLMRFGRLASLRPNETLYYTEFSESFLNIYLKMRPVVLSAAIGLGAV